MELRMGDAQTKALLKKEVLIELMQERRELFSELIAEAMEEVGLANAIREGRRNEFVSEQAVMAVLEGQV